MRLAEWLQERLGRRGSQARFARATKISDATASKWAHGGMDRAPTFENCVRIAVWAGESPLAIFEMAERPDYAELFLELFPGYGSGSAPAAAPSVCPDGDPAHLGLLQDADRALHMGIPVAAMEAGVSALLMAMAGSAPPKGKRFSPDELPRPGDLVELPGGKEIRIGKRGQR